MAKKAATKKADTKKKAADKVEDAKAPTRAAAHTVRQPIPVAANPPEQPKMIPAKQVQGATGQAVPGVAAARPIDPVTAIRVQATDTGYFDDVIRRVGDVFDIRGESEFSKKWMIRVPAHTPEKITGSNEALERARTKGEPEVATGDDDVLSEK